MSFVGSVSFASFAPSNPSAATTFARPASYHTPYVSRSSPPPALTTANVRPPSSLANVDPNLVPLHLRSFITPSVRKLQLEYTIPVPGKDTSASNAEYEKLLAENASLKTCSFVWRKRAAVHAAATLGLVGLARMARDYALRMKKERDDLEAKYNELQKLYEEKS